MKYSIGDVVSIKTDSNNGMILHDIKNNGIEFAGKIIGYTKIQHIILFHTDHLPRVLASDDFNSSSSSIYISSAYSKYLGRKIIFLYEAEIIGMINKLFCHKCNRIFYNLEPIEDFECWDCRKL